MPRRMKIADNQRSGGRELAARLLFNISVDKFFNSQPLLYLTALFVGINVPSNSS